MWFRPIMRLIEGGKGAKTSSAQNSRAASDANMDSEKEITRGIRHLLRTHGIFHYKAWQGAMSQKGVADIIGVLPGGQALAIEVKTKRGRLSEYQQAFLERFRQAGGVAFVARSPGDVVRELDLPVLFDV